MRFIGIPDFRYIFYTLSEVKSTKSGIPVTLIGLRSISPALQEMIHPTSKSWLARHIVLDVLLVSYIDYNMILDYIQGHNNLDTR